MAMIPARMMKIKFVAPLARLPVLGRVFAPSGSSSLISSSPALATPPSVERGLRRFAPSFRGDALPEVGTAVLHTLRLGAQVFASGIGRWFDAHPMLSRIVSLPALMMMCGVLPADAKTKDASSQLLKLAINPMATPARRIQVIEELVVAAQIDPSIQPRLVNLLTVLVKASCTLASQPHFNATGMSTLDHWPVGQAAMEALLKIGPPARAALAAILEMGDTLKDRKAVRVMRSHAALGLAKLQAAGSAVDPKLMQVLVEIAWETFDTDSAKRAIEGLAALGEAGKAVLLQMRDNPQYMNQELKSYIAELLDAMK